MNNLELMRKRLEWQGGVAQEDRMIHDKFRTLQKTLLYSYQACTVSIVQPHNLCLLLDENEYKNPDYRALINPDVVKQDYDDKILSIPYETGFQPGDVFEWRKTNTKWIIYLEEITEDAYFRGEIRRCRHKIKFKDPKGNWCYTWAAIRGPVETRIDSIQKNQKRIDVPNLSLNILMPQNDKTLHAFDRYSKFLFAGRCWEVQAPDSVSMKNIIEVNASEKYINKDTDDIEKEMKDGLIFQTEDSILEDGICGKAFIQPMIKEEYSVKEFGGKWSVAEKCPVKLCSAPSSNKVIVIWNKRLKGQFTLKWAKGSTVLERVITVESL